MTPGSLYMYVLYNYIVSREKFTESFTIHEIIAKVVHKLTIIRP